MSNNVSTEPLLPFLFFKPENKKVYFSVDSFCGVSMLNFDGGSLCAPARRALEVL